MTSEWKEYKLKDVCIKITDGSHYSPKATELGYPMLSVKDMQEFGFSYTNCKYITEQDFVKMQQNDCVPLENDILVAKDGSYLKHIFICKKNKQEAILSSIALFRPNTKIINPNFLCYLLKSPNIYNYIKLNCVSGSALPRIILKDFKNITIGIPLLETQQKIAKVLSAIDDKIELNNSINNNLEQQAMALFTYNFIDKSNENRISCKAEEYFDISIGKTPPRKEPEWFSVIDGVKWVSISDMGNCGMYISNSSEYLTPSAIDKYNVKIVPDNTVILSFKLTVGRVAITVGEMTTNEAIAHFKTDNKKINEYLYCYLKKFNYQTMGSTSSIATAVNSKIIKAMLFVIPTDDEINKFHTIVKPIFNQIKLNQIENSNLIQLRDTLLPKLMSGEIDVSNVDISADKLLFNKKE